MSKETILHDYQLEMLDRPHLASEGLTNEYMTDIPNGSHYPYWGDAKMINAASGKMEYLNPDWVKQQRWRKAFEELRSQVSQKRNNWDISREMVQAYLDSKYK